MNPELRDLSSRLDRWEVAAKALADRLPAAELSAAFVEISRFRRSANFQVAVVGEFGRGKSTFINRLLQRKVLPVGPVPVMFGPVSLIAGDEDTIVVRRPGGAEERRPVAHESWRDLSVRAGVARDGVSTVRVTLRSPWLAELQAEILDTPGVGDLTGDRAAIVADLLARADAAIVVLSALQPLSLTERAFIEEHVVGNSVTRVMVVVSRLDAIPPKEREEVWGHICSRVGSVAPGCAVLPLGYPSREGAAGDTNEALLSAVRTQIQTLTYRADRRAWRSRQVAGQLAEHLNSLEQAAKRRTAMVRLNDEECARARELDRAAALHGEATWESLGLELERRRRQCAQRLRESLRQSGTDVSEALSHQVETAPDVGAWWRTQFPFQLRRELRMSARRLEDLALRTAAADHAWLTASVRQRFALFLTERENVTAATSFGDGDVPNVELADINLRRLLSRLGIGAAGAIGMLLIGPLGAAASTTLGGVVSEVWLTRALAEQRNAVAPQIAGVVQEAVEEAAARIDERLVELYRDLLNGARDGQRRWQDAQTVSVRDPVEDDAAGRCAEVAEGAARLRREIEAELAGHTANGTTDPHITEQL